MSKSVVAVLRTRPETVFEDYDRLLNLAGDEDVLRPDASTRRSRSTSPGTSSTRPAPPRRGSSRA